MSPTPLDRRSFLHLAAAGGLALAAAPLAGGSPPPAAAAGALSRRGAPRLRLSLAAYSYRDAFPVNRGKPNAKVKPGQGTDLYRFVDTCAELGCEGAELTSYFFPDESDAYLLGVRRHCFLRGVSVSGTAIGNNFSHAPGPKREAEIAYTKQWIDRAVLLGAPHIRVFAGVTKELSRPEADRHVITALEECCDYAGRRGIFLGLENHDSIGSAATLLPMVQAVRSPWIGINLDSGNFRTEDPYADFAACVPYAVNVQFKTEVTLGGKKVPADLRRFTRLLREGGYQGWVALEYEAKEAAETAVPRHLKEMRELFA